MEISSLLILKPNYRISVDPRVRLQFDVGPYTVKTASHFEEIHEAISLRTRVFGEEYQVDRFKTSLDIDRHDFECDHLIIVNRATSKVVGTYRLLCSTWAKSFYSETEFELGEFLSESGVKLEIGRACIDPEFRSGAVLLSLWRGVILYAQKVNAAYIFGTTSINTEAKAEIDGLLNELKAQNLWSDRWNVQPRAAS